MVNNLIIATKNKGKVREIEDSLKNTGYKVLSLAAYENFKDIHESGTTFRQNASIKAKEVFDHFGILTLADDSGLEVDALGGAPGVYSARYSGENATDLSNCEKLLKELSLVEESKRTARFVCVMVLYDGKKFESFEGVCKGKIIYELKGNDGFGYDPLFVPDGFDKTYAELDLDTKNTISHRGRALQILKEFLDKNP